MFPEIEKDEIFTETPNSNSICFSKQIRRNQSTKRRKREMGSGEEYLKEIVKGVQEAELKALPFVVDLGTLACHILVPNSSARQQTQRLN